jgi:mycothiol S-conjugate amidase
MDKPEVKENIAEIRKAEMDKAREILGVDQAWLGFVDSGWVENYDPADVSGLPEGCFAAVSLQEASAPLVKLIRAFKPHVIITYDEEGGYPHPDHIQTHRVSIEAFDAAGDPDRYPEAGQPWQPLKLYYHMGFTKERVIALHEELLAMGEESPYTEWLENWGERADKSSRITTRVPCGEFFGLRDDALRAHATQIDPDGWWFRVPLTVQQKKWPTEDYELVRSLVDSSTPEDDLFAGVRPLADVKG